jgi:hypothetical protein
MIKKEPTLVSERAVNSSDTLFGGVVFKRLMTMMMRMVMLILMLFTQGKKSCEFLRCAKGFVHPIIMHVFTPASWKTAIAFGTPLPYVIAVLYGIRAMKNRDPIDINRFAIIHSVTFMC